MKVKRNVSRKFICRLLLFVAVVLSAVLFDASHQGSESIPKEKSHKSESSESIITTPEFCVNPVSTFKLISGADKLFSGLFFAGNQNNLLTSWYNYRSFHLLKAESFDQINPFFRSAHFMKFNCCHQTDPGDNSASA